MLPSIVDSYTFTEFYNNITTNTLNTSSNCNIVSTHDCSNGGGVFSVMSNASNDSKLNIYQIHTPISQYSAPLSSYAVISEQQLWKPVAC